MSATARPIGTAVVLLEGASDVAAVRAVAAARGVRLNDVGLVDLGGITNLRRTLADLAARGFFVCRADLEAELIRSLGPTRALSVLADLRLDAKFASFCHQPQWRDRPVEEQLHRFVGTTSGRKELLGEAFAAALPAGDVPEPLAALLELIG